MTPETKHPIKQEKFEKFMMGKLAKHVNMLLQKNGQL